MPQMSLTVSLVLLGALVLLLLGLHAWWTARRSARSKKVDCRRRM